MAKVPALSAQRRSQEAGIRGRNVAALRVRPSFRHAVALRASGGVGQVAVAMRRFRPRGADLYLQGKDQRPDDRTARRQ